MTLLPALTGKVIIPPAIADELAVGRRAGIDVPEVELLEWIEVEGFPPYPPSDGRLHSEFFPFGLIYFPLAQDPGQKFPADVSLMGIGKS